MFAAALVFAERAVYVGFGYDWLKDILFVDKSVYDWRAKDEYAVAGYWCKEKALCEVICKELLEEGKLPLDQIERVKKNLDFANA